jgi:hypothetical protein
MKLSKIVIVLLALVVMLSAYTPAPAAAAGTTMNLVITNNTPKMVTVELKGASSQTIYAYPGQTTKIVPAGKYSFLYSACGAKAKKGNLKMKKGAGALVIPACKMANIGFLNLDDSSGWSISFTGWMNYNVYVSPGQLKTQQMVAGVYSVRETACGQTLTGKVTIKGKKTYWMRCR